MADAVLSLVSEPDPERHPDLVRLRAQVATAIAEHRDHDDILEQLTGVLADAIDDSHALLVRGDGSSEARITATTVPCEIHRLIHGTRTPRWFGSWAATLTRRAETVVPDLAVSSLYREHHGVFAAVGIRSARSMPLHGRHGLLAGLAPELHLGQGCGFE